MRIDMGSPTELAWAAGFFDGEGTTCNESRKTYYVIKLQVVQVERGPLERFNSAIGNLGTIYGPYDRGNKPISHLIVTGFERIQVAVAALWPYLCQPKKDQATLALTNYVSLWKPVIPAQHGTRSYYGNHKCRCVPCKEAHSAYTKDWYKKKMTV